MIRIVLGRNVGPPQIDRGKTGNKNPAGAIGAKDAIAI
jgi:hypothetical protein